MVDFNPPIEMTRFKVGLEVDVETSKLPIVGSPLDWKWDLIVDKMCGGEARTNASVHSVLIESTFDVDEDGELIENTTYTPLTGPSEGMDVAAAFQIVLDLAKENVLDDKYVDDNELREQQDRQQEALKIAEDFVTNHLGDE